jgi:putative effector of murein hydrolase LrgA (UPF0299 family)
MGVGVFTEFDSLIDKYFPLTVILSMALLSSLARAGLLTTRLLTKSAVAMAVSLNFKIGSPYRCLTY